MVYIIGFVLFFIFAIFVDLSKIAKQTKGRLLFVTLGAIALMVGFREPRIWNDSMVYLVSFQNASTLETLSLTDVPIGYSEFGFYLIGVILKTIVDNSVIYFVFISALTFFFLYCFLKEYCLFPLIGLCIYMGRFLVGRNMMQIRAALAIAIILLATKYVTEKKLWKFLLVVVIGYCIHHSMLLVIPLYFISKIKIKKIHIVLGLCVAFVVAGYFSSTIIGLMRGSDFVNEMAVSYVQEGGRFAYSSSLANPMIYYQSLVLLIFTFFENQLSRYTPHYYTIRNAYFFSTILLIVLCSFAIVAARTSTIFATYEIIIIPLFILLFNKQNRFLPILIILVLFSIFFALNWKPVELTDFELNNAIMHSN